MPWLIALLAFAGPFWLEKPASEWTDIQLSQFFADSPWARMTTAAGKNALGPPVAVYIASAGPAGQAERERERRLQLRRKQSTDTLAEEYHAWFEQYRPTEVILAIRVGNSAAFSDAAEIRRMEEGCWMRTPRGRVKVTAHFPPSSRDPYLRVAFPRSYVNAEEKTLGFDLYLPGVTGPIREVQFSLKDIMVDGKPDL